MLFTMAQAQGLFMSSHRVNCLYYKKFSSQENRRYKQARFHVLNGGKFHSIYLILINQLMRLTTSRKCMIEVFPWMSRGLTFKNCYRETDNVLLRKITDNSGERAIDYIFITKGSLH